MELSDLLIPVLTVIFGILVSFNGFKFFRLSITIIGGLIGYELSTWLIKTYSKTWGISEDTTVKTVLIIAVTLLMAALAFAIYQKAVILLSAVGFMYYYVDFSSSYEVRDILIGLGIGVIIGSIIFLIQKWAIILFTSVVGAKFAGDAIITILMSFDIISEFIKDLGEIVVGEYTITIQLFITLILIVALSIAGFVSQIQDEE